MHHQYPQSIKKYKSFSNFRKKLLNDNEPKSLIIWVIYHNHFQSILEIVFVLTTKATLEIKSHPV